jgi:hypothetical protein
MQFPEAFRKGCGKAAVKGTGAVFMRGQEKPIGRQKGGLLVPICPISFEPVPLWNDVDYSH